MTDDEIMRQLSQAVRDDDLLAAEELTNVELWRQAASLRRSILLVPCQATVAFTAWATRDQLS
jgi:hypothetical protein